jgi:single-strand DNA-binding protein
MNVVMMQGRPTRDPEISKSESGKVYCRIRLAVDRPYRGKNVPRKSDYFTVVFFGKLAQTAFNNLAKGALCTILGRLEQGEYLDKIGNKREKYSIIADKLTIHEWLRKHRPLEELDAGFDDELLVPREITGSLFKQIDITDEDIPDDLAGENPFEKGDL